MSRRAISERHRSNISAEGMGAPMKKNRRAVSDHWKIASAGFDHSGWDSPALRPERTCAAATRAVLDGSVRDVDAMVIGAGRRGLMVARELLRTGFVGYIRADGEVSAAERGAPTFVVCDAESVPGGSWSHRWETLQIGDDTRPARLAIPERFARFEDTWDLPIVRPTRVLGVCPGGADGDGLGVGAGVGAGAVVPQKYLVVTDHGVWRTSAVISCSGRWSRPFIPWVRGRYQFKGSQFHTRDFPPLTRLAGKKVAVIGTGFAARSHVRDLSEVAKVRWYAPGPKSLRRSLGQVESLRTPGKMITARRMFPALGSHYLDFTRTDRGFAPGSGKTWEVDALVWATGFRPEIRHLAPLRLARSHGTVILDSTTPPGHPRLHIFGYHAPHYLVRPDENAAVVTPPADAARGEQGGASELARQARAIAADVCAQLGLAPLGEGSAR